MNIDAGKSQLIIEVFDGDDLEFHITATNGRYFGMTEVYADEKALKVFANSLTGYPNGKQVSFEAGIKDGYSFFNMKYNLLNPAGYISVEVYLEDKVVERAEGRDQVKLEIIVLPSAIDRFQKELFGIIAGTSDVAILYGKDVSY